VKQLLVMNSVVAGLKFHCFAKKTGKLQFHSDTFKPFNMDGIWWLTRRTWPSLFQVGGI